MAPQIRFGISAESTCIACRIEGPKATYYRAAHGL